jgi:hypothetical protein
MQKNDLLRLVPVGLLAGALIAFAVQPIVAQQQTTTTQDAELLPPNAKPGECYARVWVPPVYQSEAQQVVKKEASEQIEIIPAKWEDVVEKVIVKEATETIEVIPAEYEWVEEKVLVKSASKKIVEVPAVYETVKEQVVDQAEHTVWKKGRDPIENVTEGTGEIMCLVTIPATFKTVTKQMLKAPATVKEVEIPAEYTTLKKRVVKTPATTKKVAIPAEYKEVKVHKLVTPPTVKRTATPAEYQEVSHSKLVKEGRMEWRTVLCETNTTPDVVVRIQKALTAAGYNPGPADGVIGAGTHSALRQYQKAKGLAEGGLTAESLRSLGVI